MLEALVVIKRPGCNIHVMLWCEGTWKFKVNMVVDSDQVYPSIILQEILSNLK